MCVSASKSAEDTSLPGETVEPWCGWGLHYEERESSVVVAWCRRELNFPNLPREEVKRHLSRWCDAGCGEHVNLIFSSKDGLQKCGCKDRAEDPVLSAKSHTPHPTFQERIHEPEDWKMNEEARAYIKRIRMSPTLPESCTGNHAAYRRPHLARFWVVLQYLVGKPSVKMAVAMSQFFYVFFFSTWETKN